MSIIIFGDSFSFPEGNAATNRVHTYAKGFYENGIQVHVICFSNDYVADTCGISEGIHYYHPFGQKTRSKYLLKRRWLKLIKYYKAFQICKSIQKNDKIIAINFWTETLLTHLFSFLLTKALKTRAILERSENPLRNCQGSILNQFYGQVKLHLEILLYDGFICISHHLIEFYKTRGVNQKRLFLVPSTVDPSRFTIEAEKPVDFKYLGYFGSLTFERDDVDVLIRAFKEISLKYPDIHLVLGGSGSDVDREKIINLILTLKIENKVLLLDYLSRSDIINYITHSEVLVMVRKNDMKSKASYPSKLTEYLTTSIPIVTVNVGEISDYLTDGTNCFLAEAGNQKALFIKIDFVLCNYNLALEVAKKGKELTQTIFNYNYQAKRLIEIFNSL